MANLHIVSEQPSHAEPAPVAQDSLPRLVGQRFPLRTVECLPLLPRQPAAPRQDSRELPAYAP